MIMEPTTQELAGMASQFLARVQLTGQEVPAFNAVMGWLQKHAEQSDLPD
jgi:hypothetical protein